MIFLRNLRWTLVFLIGLVATVAIFVYSAVGAYYLGTTLVNEAVGSIAMLASLVILLAITFSVAVSLSGVEL